MNRELMEFSDRIDELFEPVTLAEADNFWEEPDNLFI